MNPIAIFFLLSLSHFTFAQNVAMTSLTGPIAVATSSSGGLAARISSTPDLIVDPPQDIAAFTDVSIDGSLVFALSVAPPQVCSYIIATDTPSLLSLINCVESAFAVSPFCGISSLGGTLIISGGTGGVTVFDYDATGKLEQSPRILNFDLQVIGNPDVVMVNPTQAALSSDIGGSPRFGTIVVNTNGTTLTPVGEFRNPSFSGFDNALGPSNFPFVNDVYTNTNGDVFLYTANGGMTVQNINVADSIVEIAAPVQGFQAVTVSVNQESELVVFGGLLPSGESIIYAFDIENDMALIGQVQVEGRVTSVATSEDIVSFVTQDDSTIQDFAFETMTTVMPTDSSASPPPEPTTPTLSPVLPSPTMPTAAADSTSSGSYIVLAQSTALIMVVPMLLLVTEYFGGI
jgi:hypothetical protein